jgi:uncharacterized membrane protein YcgQ (UPF0703/DUF1980 family)
MTKYSKEKNQETALAIVLGLLVIWYFTRIMPLIYVSIALVAIGLLIQPLAGWITWFWLKLSHVMGWVMSKVILSVVFYLFLFPIAALSRLFKPDVLGLKKDGKTSYYTERNHKYSPEDLENPW